MTDSMLQQLIVIAIVVAAAGFIALRVMRAVKAARARRDASCASGCGCAPAPSGAAPEAKQTSSG